LSVDVFQVEGFQSWTPASQLDNDIAKVQRPFLYNFNGQHDELLDLGHEIDSFLCEEQARQVYTHFSA